MNYHHLLRIVLQVAVVVSTIKCHSARASVELACTGSKLTDIVRHISKTRFDTRDTKPKLARCQSFLQLIRGQPELAELAPQLARDEPRGQLDEIARILELRASCPGQLMGGLGPLQEFIGDCQELVELASCARGPATAAQKSPSESELPKGRDDELKKLRDTLAEKLETVTRMTGENAKVSRQLQEQREQQAIQLRELQLKKGELSRKLIELDQLHESTTSRGREDRGKIEELQSRFHELQEISADQMRANQELEEQKTALAQKLSELLSNEAAHKVKIQTLEETNAKLSSELKKQKPDDNKTAVQASRPGSYVELELERDANGELGLFSSHSVYGSVFVNKVMAGSPAARAGLKFGDQLVQVNGHSTAHLNGVSQLTGGQSRVRLLVRKSPMQQKFVIKQQPGEQGPGFFCTRWDHEIYEISQGRAAARAGMLANSRWIAMNGESVLGLDAAAMTPETWWPKGEYTVTTMPSDFFNQLTWGLSPDDLNSIRIEHNKILADESARNRVQV